MLLLVFFFYFSFSLCAQNANKAYAITGQSAGNFNWTDIREIDLSTGKVSNVIFESGKTRFSLAKNIGGRNVLLGHDANNFPMQSMVAAAAYDQRHNKLFFTPMKIGELRWLDLSAGSEP